MAASFPPFLWGSATSSHQIEGNNCANDWWAWETQGRLKIPSGLACDSYNRFHEDFEIISRLGHNAHRFSLEWSRFEPEENQWNEEAFAHYDEVFRELQARKIEPVVTLHHFTNPEWFSKKGGWLSDQTVPLFCRYVDRVVRAYGKYVRFWITINEPLIYLYHGFFSGLWPPGFKSYDDSLKVFKNQIYAHVGAYRTIHSGYEAHLKQRPAVSMAMHMTHFTPCNPNSMRDRWAAFARNWFVNTLFPEALRTGYLFYPGVFSEFLPLRNTLDYIGLNYYTRDFIRYHGIFGEGAFLGSVVPKEECGQTGGEKNEMGWDIYPEGLYLILRDLARFKLPVMVTENGICAREDTQRVRFIRDHLESVSRARREGVPVNGYFYWSLLDNFEWAHGFEPRFGIVEVDYKTQQRKIRPSAHVLSEMCRKMTSESPWVIPARF